MVEAQKLYHNRLLQELLFFIGMFILTILHEWMRLDSFDAFFKGLVFFILLYGQAQLHRYLIFPLFIAKRYWLYATVTFVATLMCSVLLCALYFFWMSPEPYQNSDTSLYAEIVYHFVACIITTFSVMAFFLVRQYTEELQKKKQTQLLLSEMNLKFLHAQLNPHFFFNMFNNLYGVSLTDPKRTPGLILKLSELMRYQLENGNESHVSIDEELCFIENYIAMEKERIGKRCEIMFSFPEDKTLIANYRIAPLILITLIENAFKHSITTTRKWFVHLFVTIDESELCVQVENSLADETLKSQSTGIGLINIKERLAMLYKDQYVLSASVADGVYKTVLTIKLSALKNG